LLPYLHPDSGRDVRVLMSNPHEAEGRLTR